MAIRSVMAGLVSLSLSACGGAQDSAAGTGGTQGVGTGGAGSAAGGTTSAGGSTAVGTGGSVAAGGASLGAGGTTIVSSGGVPGAGGTTVGAAGAGAGGTTSVASQEMSFQMDGFQVAPGGEFYKCQDFPNTFGGNIAILESKSMMAKGSHHMFVFRLSSGGFYGGMSNLGPGNTKGPLVDCPSGGTEFHPFVHTAQTPEQDNTYPPGVGQAFNSDETVRIMAHYLNTTSNVINATVNVTLKYVPATAVKDLAASMFLNSIGLKVPAGTVTRGFDYKATADMNLLGAASHMHRRGTHFTATAKLPDGTTKMLYTSDTWDEPVPTAFSPALLLPNGTTIHWACTYANTTGKTLSFGESANTNEMCIFTGTFYPAPGGGGIYDQDFSAGMSM